MIIAYHDGGYTPPDAAADKPAIAGWGYQLQYIPLADLPGGDDLPTPTAQVLGHGPVMLDDGDATFCGAITLSNNTAELSALPHILITLLIRRRAAMAAAARAAGTLHYDDRYANPTEHVPAITLVLAHDSQYVKDTCECKPGAPPAATNTTLVSLCRRLLREAADCGIKVVWVKVRGHSEAAAGGAVIPAASRATVDGNETADGAADDGAKFKCKDHGHDRSAVDINSYINWHLHAEVDIEVWQARRDASTRLH